MRSYEKSVFCQIRYIRLSKLQLFVKTKVTKHVEWPMDKIAIEKTATVMEIQSNPSERYTSLQSFRYIDK